MNELMKLVAALTDLAVEATEYLKKENGKPYQPQLPIRDLDAAHAADDAARVAAAAAGPKIAPLEDPAPKKERKPRAPKAAPAPESTGPVAAAVAAGEPVTAQELTEEQSYTKMMEVTKSWVVLAKNDTPDGKTWAMGELRSRGKEKLTDLNHEERLEWIALMEKSIAEHK